MGTWNGYYFGFGAEGLASLCWAGWCTSKRCIVVKSMASFGQLYLHDVVPDGRSTNQGDQFKCSDLIFNFTKGGICIVNIPILLETIYQSRYLLYCIIILS